MVNRGNLGDVSLDRRTLLRRAGQGSLALAVAGAGVACSSQSDDSGSGGGSPSAGGSASGGPVSGSASDGSGPSGSGSGGSGSGSGGAAGALPSFVKFEGVKPDIAAANANAIDGFLTYPDPPIDAVPEAPLSGGTVTAISALSIITPQPMDKNNWWKNINSEIGATLDLTMVPGPDYPARFSSMVAGGNLPELVRVPAVPNMDQVLKAEFADLTEYLSGDAVKEYPLLANIPTVTWTGAVYNGRIYGVPMTLLPIGNRVEVRSDVMKSLDLPTQPQSADDFLKICGELTDAKATRWAMVQPINNFTKEMCGVPNNWDVVDGKFTKDIETDQFKQWLSFVKGMWDKGYFHPDSFSNPQVAGLFEGRHFMFFEVGGQGFTSAMAIYTKVDPELTVEPVPPPKYDGGGVAPVYLGVCNNGITSINKKASAARVKDLLKVMNFLAGPFGTEQYLDTQFGAKGPDYSWTAGQGPVPTSLATKERIMTNYMPGAPMVMYSANFPDVTKAECEYEKTVGRTALPYPTLGLYSSTDSGKGATLTKLITNACGDIIQGHKPLSAWDGIVKNWRNGGGETIRQEYQDQYAANHS